VVHAISTTKFGAVLCQKLINITTCIDLQGLSFFDTLRLYLKQTNKDAGIVQSVTDMPLIDAQSMHAELT